MRFVAIETSTDWCSVALWKDAEICCIERPAGTSHSAMVLPMLRELLERAGVRTSELDAVAFGAGPGSFTGLRIACGVAQGLAYAHSLPVLGVSTLEALAEQCGAERVVACIDARMREVYAAAMQRDSHDATPLWRMTWGPLCIAPQDVPALPDGQWAGCGDGFVTHGDALRAAFGVPLARIAPTRRPSAAAIAQIAARGLAAGEGVDPSCAWPVYVRDKVALTEQERAERSGARAAGAAQ